MDTTKIADKLAEIVPGFRVGSVIRMGEPRRGASCFRSVGDIGVIREVSGIDGDNPIADFATRTAWYLHYTLCQPFEVIIY